jgi:hypothetical protein
MANSRPEDESTQNAEEIAWRTTEKIAEQTRRIGETAAEAGQDIAQAGAELLQKNAETLQNALRLGVEVTTAVMGRSTDQLSRTFGLSGNEAQQATERSARNTVILLRSSGVVSQGMRGMSQEYSSSGIKSRIAWTG